MYQLINWFLPAGGCMVYLRKPQTGNRQKGTQMNLLGTGETDWTVGMIGLKLYSRLKEADCFSRYE